MRLDSLLLGEMEASLSVQPQEEELEEEEEEEEEEEGASRIQSRDGSGGGSRARPSWFHRALSGLLMWKHPAAVEPPARALVRERERAPTEKPRWRSSLKKAVGSALARVSVACVGKPVCSGVHDDDVVDSRKSPPPRRRRRRRRRSIRSGARSPPEAVLTGESDDYWTFAFRGRSSLTDEMLMRRFVLEEDAMRRRMEMRQAAGGSWLPPGPSRLSQMSLADDDDNGGRGRREQFDLAPVQ